MYKPNLLPYKFRPKPLIEPKRFFILLITSLFIFSIIYGLISFRITVINEQAEVQYLKEAIDQLDAVTSRYTELQKMRDKNKELQNLSIQLRNSTVNWSEILMDISRILGENVNFISLGSEQEKETIKSNTNDKQNQNEEINNYLVIEGTAKNMKEVGQYALDLRSLPWCNDVKVRIITEDEVEGILIFELTPEILGGGVK